MTPTLSIIIVNWNTRDLLRACLHSLPWEAPGLALDVVVVDNASSDRSVEMVQGEFPRVRLIVNETNTGFVRANNQGLRAAEGEYLLMLNSDTEVQPGCLERLVATLTANPGAGAAGPRLLNSDGTSQVSYGDFPRLRHRFTPNRAEERYRSRVEKRTQAGEETVEVGWLGGAALLTTRPVLRQVGVLDERWFMWYDDLDWCHRLHQAGYRRLFVPGALVVHHGRQSGGKLASEKLQTQLFDSEYLYLRVHAGRLATFAAFSLRVSKALGKLLTGAPPARADARFRLRYHRERFARFCLAPLPAPQIAFETSPDAAGPHPEGDA